MPNLIDRTIAGFSTSQHWFADRPETWLAQDLTGRCRSLNPIARLKSSGSRCTRIHISQRRENGN
jgi:hypothetical protein